MAASDKNGQTEKCGVKRLKVTICSNFGRNFRGFRAEKGQIALGEGGVAKTAAKRKAEPRGRALPLKIFKSWHAFCYIVSVR